MPEEMTPCQPQPASDDPTTAPSAMPAASEALAGDSTEPEGSSSSSSLSSRSGTPTSKVKVTGGTLKARAAARLEAVMETVDRDLRLPLDDQWYISWDGSYNFDLVEIVMSDPTHRWSDGTSKPKHMVRAYCGSSFAHALRLYSEKKLQTSGAKTVEAVLAALAKIEATIAKVMERLNA